MGVPNTNAGLAASQSATGTTEYGNKALETKIKYADAMNTASHAYREGIDRSVGFGANPDTAKFQQFQSQWAQNFDPRVYAVDNAMRRKDAPELAKIKREVGTDASGTYSDKRASAAMADLHQKTLNLRSLATTGSLPSQ
jgi:hypothetical protein